MPETYITTPQPFYTEGSSLTATAYFKVGEVATAPTTAKYRLDCLTTCKVLKDWTTLTPAESISIAITATENAMQDEWNTREKKQLTVASDPDTDTQTRDVVTWLVINNEAF